MQLLDSETLLDLLIGASPRLSHLQSPALRSLLPPLLLLTPPCTQHRAPGHCSPSTTAVGPGGEP